MNLSKTSLRKKFLLQRKKRDVKSHKFNFNLLLKLIKKNFKKKVINIAAYYPVDNEVNVLNFFEKMAYKKFKILLPVIKSSKIMNFKSWIFKEPLYVNSFGILEPKNKNRDLIPDVVLVPLVAFDRKLNRIGYGRGYYDRKLKKIKNKNTNIISIGLAYSFQKCLSIPTNKHDFKLDYIFTERGIISSN
jgi:5-formyltetrahydrofolate cyclo-ligase